VAALQTAFAAAALAQQAAPPVVSVTTVQLQDIAPRSEFIGRVEAINAVDIRARLDGFIQQRPFQEGQLVHAGDLLYLIEPAPYQAALAAAKAENEGAQGNLRSAEQALARAKQLSATGTGTQVALEQAQAARDTAAANAGTADSNLRRAELNFSYTRVTSPIDGRIGRSAFAVGSLVGPTSNPLARVVQVDPIRVVFSVSDRTLTELRESTGDAPLEQLYQRFVPTLRLATGTMYGTSGHIAFVGNEVDQQTGTVPVWAEFANPDGILVPGQFVTAVIRRAQSQQKPVVPLAAVQQDRDGRFVLIVDQSGKVAMRRIRTGAQVGQNWAVEDGLQGGEQLIVEGFQNARIGEPVRTVATTRPVADAAKPGSTPAGSAASQ